MESDVSFSTEPEQIRVTLVGEDDVENMLLAMHKRSALSLEYRDGSLTIVIEASKE